MIGKLIEGVLITPSENERKKIIITNPNDEILKIAMGYKDLFYDEKPEYDAETQCLEESVEEKDESIYVHYDVKDINEVTDNADSEKPDNS